MLRGSFPQFHSSFWKLGSKSTIKGIHSLIHFLCRLYSCVFCLMKWIFQAGNLLVVSRASLGKAAVLSLLDSRHNFFPKAPLYKPILANPTFHGVLSTKG